jgi:hypothetical protein
VARIVEQQDAMQVRSVVDRLVDQVVRASEVSRMAEQVSRMAEWQQQVLRMAEHQDAMQVRSVVVTVMKELPEKVEKNPLPAEGISIEVQWTVQDENYLKWFTAEVVKPNVTQKQARQEKRFERRAKCHQIQYTMPPKDVEWVLLEWAERPAKRRKSKPRAGTSSASKNKAKNKAKKEAAEEEAPWRYQAVGARV